MFIDEPNRKFVHIWKYANYHQEDFLYILLDWLALFSTLTFYTTHAFCILITILISLFWGKFIYNLLPNRDNLMDWHSMMYQSKRWKFMMQILRIQKSKRLILVVWLSKRRFSRKSKLKINNSRIRNSEMHH